ncbi:MAG: TolC family protein [Verrucomicrobiota bacterium]
MKFRSLLLASGVALIPSWAADAVKTRDVTLEQCIQEAFENNLELKIVRYAPDLADLALEGSYSAYDPNFGFGYNGNRADNPSQRQITSFQAPANVSYTQQFNTSLSGLLPTEAGTSYQLTGNMNPVRSRVGGNGAGFLQYQDSAFGNAGIALSQPLLRNLWIDQARWAISLNKKTLLQEEQTVRAQMIQTATDVQLVYYNLAAAMASIEVQTKAVELAERLLTENRKRVEVGAMAPLESQQAEAQVASTRADLIQARQNFGTAQNNLRRLLTTDYSEIRDTQVKPSEKFSPQPYPFSRPESWSRGLTMRPDVLQSQIEMEKQNVTVRFRRNQLFPQLDLTGSFGVSANQIAFGNTNGSPPLGDPVGGAFDQLGNADYKSYGVGARFTFPLGNIGARSAFQTAKITKERLILRHKQIEQNVMRDIDNSILVAESAYGRILANREARAYAEAAFDAEQKKLENGKSTTFEVLRLQRDLTSARSNEVRSELDYYAALSSLFRDEGSTLERLGVRITAQ